MDTNEKLLLKDEVFQIVGAAFDVLNGVGHGFHEKPYENALVVELDASLPYEVQWLDRWGAPVPGPAQAGS